VAELVAGVGRGVLVSDLWYTRLLDPRTLALTGLTRNGIWLIEDGELAGPVRNFRFTQSYAQALMPGNVRGSVGRDADPRRHLPATSPPLDLCPALHPPPGNYRRRLRLMTGRRSGGDLVEVLQEVGRPARSPCRHSEAR
jgi:hypothetical protein